MGTLGNKGLLFLHLTSSYHQEPQPSQCPLASNTTLKKPFSPRQHLFMGLPSPEVTRLREGPRGSTQVPVPL